LAQNLNILSKIKPQKERFIGLIDIFPAHPKVGG
jgi:hypothetical protein